MLALKLFLVPSLIWVITPASRRWDPAVAGWLTGFPVVSAPVLFFLAVDQGGTFAATAAAATLSAVLAVLVFSLGYAWTARRLGWPPSLVAGLACYAVTVALLHAAGPPPWLSAPVVYAVVAVAPRLLPVLPPPSRAPPASRVELILRMVAGGALVVTLTVLADDLGPRMSGLLAMFPVLGTVLAVFTHRQAGAAFTIRLLRGMTVGYYAFTTFCLVLALALPPMSIGMAFALSLALATMVQVFARRYVRPG
jgi:hypothetical protein